MNKEKILNKIGALIDKAELTEEDLAKFFAPDGEPKPNEPESEQPKEDPVETEQPESDESDKGEEGKPEEEKPSDEPKEEPKPSSEAVPEAKPEEACENHVTKDEVVQLIEGYKAEIESLKEVLRKAGVLEDVSIKGSKQVGVGVTSAPNLQRGEGGIEETIAKLNRGRH